MFLTDQASIIELKQHIYGRSLPHTVQIAWETILYICKANCYFIHGESCPNWERPELSRIVRTGSNFFMFLLCFFFLVFFFNRSFVFDDHSFPFAYIPPHASPFLPPSNYGPKM